MLKEYQIKTINWLDKDIKEASADIEIDGRSYSFFCFPCDFKQGEKVYLQFSGLVFDSTSIKILKNELKFILENLEGDEWSYKGIGKIVSMSPLCLDFGDISVDLDGEIHIGNLNIGDVLEVQIDRLDGELRC